MVTYFDDEFDDRWNISRQNGETNYRWDGVERTETLPAWLGQGWLQTTLLPNGLSMQISQEAYATPFKHVRPHESGFPLTGKFYLSGQVQVKTPGIVGEYVETAGHNYLYCLPNTEEVESYQSEKSTDFVMLWITPCYLKTFMGGQLESCPPELLQFAQSRTCPFFHRCLGKNSAAMQMALHQMIQCPYQGLVRRMFLESRATELLALQLEQWSLVESSSHSPMSGSDRALKSADLDCIHQAQQILQQRIEDPPSLLELAQLVGLNDRKLKQGFHQVFGTTVFGYLHDYRLEQARQLLSKDRMSVAEVAYAVGFSNRSYFAIAFRRKFGVNPSEFLAESRKFRRVFC
jgi:AraC-like DNA-binding protein